MRSGTPSLPNAALFRRISEIISDVDYKPDTGFKAGPLGDGVYLQHYQYVADCKTGEPSMQKGRKFYISPHMTDGEILRTCALAVKVFEEHEANEWLTYRGERLLNPHPEGPRPEAT